jgi:hypothetical protein
MARKVVGALFLVICTLLVLCRSSPVTAPSENAARDYSTELRVFPGAEGFGVDRRAGRRGTVVRADHLPEKPEDRNTNGYTNLEEWLHEMAAKVEGQERGQGA